MVSEKKKTILKSAEMLFSTHGFNRTTVAYIAQESGIHEASIYSYFGNKRNILFAIYANYLQNAIESLNEHFQGMKEPGPKLRKSIWHYLADMKNNQYCARTLIMAQRENPDFYSSEQVRYIKEYSSLVLGVVITAQKEGFFLKNLSPRLIRNMAMGTCVFTVFDSLIHNRPYDPNEMSDIIYQLVINATCVDSPVAENSVKMTRSEKAELRRSQIIETSIQVFSKKGFSNATISEVANHANLGDATLYEYFDNKEAILMGTAETYLQNLVSDEDINLRNSSEPEKALRKLIWRWIWQLYTYKEFSRVLVLELFRNIRFYSSPGYEYLVAFHEKIRETVQQGQKEGIFIEDVPFPTYFHMITGTLDQFLLSQFLLNRPPLGIAELNDTVDSFVRAIKTRKNP